MGLASGALLAAPPGLRLVSVARAQEPTIYDDDRILGSPDAPITIIEYSSLTCPHCANFHKNTLPQVKKEWIETGRARLVYRHFPLDNLGLRAALVSNCLEGNLHFVFLDALFKGQEKWARSQDPIGSLARIASLAGMDKPTFDACIDDKNEINSILARQREIQSAYEVNSTPTFIINGRKVQGAGTYEEFNKVLEDIQSQT
jgi:protein-disulfide isomerase